MFTSLRRFALLSAAALLVVGTLTATSHAQARVLWNSNRLINPNYQIYPGLSYRQYAYNMALLGRAYSQIPPYALGYNPYGTYYVNPYASYGYNPYASYGYNPYAYYGYNPYQYYGYNPYSYYGSPYSYSYYWYRY
ncbi:MAG TPA: hypothetical protein VJ739_03055 [Gemmataceae bacterium]|nr:hypothetical protein [Gemmataceae bacterium]